MLNHPKRHILLGTLLVLALVGGLWVMKKSGGGTAVTDLSQGEGVNLSPEMGKAGTPGTPNLVDPHQANTADRTSGAGSESEGGAQPSSADRGGGQPGAGRNDVASGGGAV